MKIGIVVFSKTNHTFSVAEKLNQRLANKGHDVTLARIEGLNTEPRDKGPVNFTTIPNIEGYDVLILGTPVWGFSLPAAMKEYLEQLPVLAKKKFIST